ncbi:MAG: type II secretion system protein, partial [Pseudomonadota bacterium]|nr:type II secretion system protein [Pseudomonadota bacterium]
MINSEGFTILEFLLVSVIAAALLTAAMPLFQDLQYLMIKQTQLSQLFIRAQLGYSILRQAVNTAGSISCLNGRRPAALQVVERSIIHDKTVSDDNNVLMVNGCKIYNSQQHWLQTAYFIARSSVAAVPALYSKIIAIDKMPVSLPKVEEIAGVNSLHFFGCVFVDSRWRCNTTLLSA